jgi:hypothetical protein
VSSKASLEFKAAARVTFQSFGWWAGRESNPHSFRYGFTDR